jgi:hypothetical protein
MLWLLSNFLDELATPDASPLLSLAAIKAGRRTEADAPYLIPDAEGLTRMLA